MPPFFQVPASKDAFFKWVAPLAGGQNCKSIHVINQTNQLNQIDTFPSHTVCLKRH